MAGKPKKRIDYAGWSDEDVSECDWESKVCERAVKAWNMEYKGDR